MVKVVSTATGKPNFSKAGKIIFIFICILAIVFGSFGLYVTFNNVVKSIESQNWDTTNGEIIVSEIIEKITHGRNVVNEYTYSADIRYEYTVDSESYISSNVAFGSGGVSTSDKGYAEGIVNKYPVGKTVNVYYNSNDSSESVLEPGVNFNQLILFILSLFFVLIGIILPIYFFKTKRFNSFFRRGEIDIDLDKKSYIPGETIKGKLFLKTKKAVKAQALAVFFGAEKNITRDNNPYGRVRFNTTTTTYDIFKNKKVIGSQKVYYKDEYFPFEINIPKNTLERVDNWGENGEYLYGLNKDNSSERAMAVQRGASQLFGQYVKMRRIKEDVNYFVEAQLYINKKLDIKGKVKIELKKN